MTQSIRLGLLSRAVALQLLGAAAMIQVADAQSTASQPMAQAAAQWAMAPLAEAAAAARTARTEWNNPEDIALVSRSFTTWTDAVIAKDKATVESFHDEGFRAGLGDRLFNKAQHVELELAVANTEMKLLKVQATRRIGDILLVWSQHFIRVDSLPEIPSLGLLGDWGDEKMAKQGFTQDEISVWRFEGGRIKCLAFAASRTSRR